MQSYAASNAIEQVPDCVNLCKITLDNIVEPFITIWGLASHYLTPLPCPFKTYCYFNFKYWYLLPLLLLHQLLHIYIHFDTAWWIVKPPYASSSSSDTVWLLRLGILWHCINGWWYVPLACRMSFDGSSNMHFYHIHPMIVDNNPTALAEAIERKYFDPHHKWSISYMNMHGLADWRWARAN